MCQSIVLLVGLTLIVSQRVCAQIDSAALMTFPLGPGNLWQYKEPPPPFDPSIYEVKSGRDTTLMNGKTYRQFLRNNYGNPDTYGINYRRQEGNKVFEYFPLLQIEAVKYDFSKNAGDTVSIFPRRGAFGLDTSIVTVLGGGTTTFWGKMRKYMAFYDRSMHGTMYWIDHIADSLGIYFSETEPGFRLRLEGARIDGVQYGTITNVLAQGSERPHDFVLHQNYPNPFNSSTTISFHLSAISKVELTVWNSLGEKVRTLFEGTLDRGSHQIRWDGKGDRHSDLPSGVYFYRMQIAQSRQTGMAVLLR